MGAIKIKDLETHLSITIEDTIEVSLNVHILDSARGEITKAQFTALQEKVNTNFIKSMQNIII